MLASKLYEKACKVARMLEQIGFVNHVDRLVVPAWFACPCSSPDKDSQMHVNLLLFIYTSINVNLLRITYRRP